MIITVTVATELLITPTGKALLSIPTIKQHGYACTVIITKLCMGTKALYLQLLQW